MDKSKLALLLCSVLFSSSVYGADETDDLWSDEGWDDSWEEESNWSQSGFVELGYGQRLNKDPLFSDKDTLNELRAELKFDYQGENIDFTTNLNTWYDNITDNQEFDLREFNISFSAFGNTDFKIGRQISTWGTGDLVFLNDLFPKDWKSFFSGREDTYLKAPANSIRVSSYFDAVNMDLVWTPEFTEDRYIDGERFSLFSPLAGQNIGGSDVINPIEPEQNIGNSEVALRLYKTIEGTEYALYGYRGFDKQPVGLTQDLQPTFYRKNVFGASVRGSLGEGLYHAEVAYHDAKDDGEGTDPLKPNSQVRFLLGYETEVISRLTLGLQYYVELTQDYDELISQSPTPQFEANEKRDLITTRLTYRSQKDEWIWSLFGFYSFSDKDSYIRPNVSYRLNDQWQFSAGANIFSGEDRHTFFGQFEDASNAYLRVRYSF